MFLKALLLSRMHARTHTHRYKQRTGDLGEITNHDTLKEAATSLEDGFRLTIWAYDKQEVCLTTCNLSIVPVYSGFCINIKRRLCPHSLLPPQSSPEPSDPVIMEVIAIADYTAQYSDELTFSVGEKIQVTVESKLGYFSFVTSVDEYFFPLLFVPPSLTVNEDWYEGRCHKSTGIFPKAFVEDA